MTFDLTDEQIAEAVSTYDEQTRTIETTAALEPANVLAALRGITAERRAPHISMLDAGTREQVVAAMDRMEAALRRHLELA